ncbi:hypothetical protein P8625_01115 [Tenacibaculum tangerinum]|uniref:DinB family protein n=1 Tax=Tenacibaculum tangerinum TaxID=3038772 RepID=A0ABY8L2X8_9FLAO|nr:hypothetical protein [Tenacibaculum tangerinum]WGH75792.1 hypothetical protein P8625_01115 [Tenacibaculum tangerinum]
MKTVLAPMLLLFAVVTTNAQDKLPYYEIPKEAKKFTQGSVISRMIDGVGFRYYWATEGLTEKDLAYKPSAEAKTAGETIDHILSLSEVIKNAALNQSNDKKEVEMTFAQKRKATLENLKQASDILRESNDISQFKIIFGENKFPLWNAINGPIADAIWHAGQLASFRRASGNPINSKINHFTGTVRQ